MRVLQMFLEKTLDTDRVRLYFSETGVSLIMKTVSALTMRLLDARTIRSGILSGMDLMRAAGAAVFRELCRAFPEGPVVILAGKGNNGGDGFIVASLLAEGGREVRLFTPADETSLKGDARGAFLSMSGKLRQSARKDFSPEDLAGAAVIVDAMLGTGFSGPLRDPFDRWIGLVNGSGIPVLAVDIPSGLNADDGSADCAVRADLTVTFALPKTGLLIGKGPAFAGRIVPAAIGIPPSFLEEAPGELLVTAAEDVKPLLGREAFNVYKNSRGHLFVIGGSAAYSGAPFLAAEAALRGGAGLVTVFIPEGTNIRFSIPKALMVHTLPSENGVFAPRAAGELSAMLSRADALVLGPGISLSSVQDPFLEALLRTCRAPMLIDADGLNRISAEVRLAEALCGRPRGKTVLTPHEGEMRRLEPVWDLKSEGRTSAERAAALAQVTGAVTVLKGPHTAVCSENGVCALNLSGCQALATAGSGDVLSGATGAFLARGAEPFEAARAGVYLHGVAGELAAPLPHSGRGVLSDDLPRLLPDAMRRISQFA